MHRLQRIKGCGGKTLVTIVGRRRSGAMNYIAVIRRLASTCTPAHTLNCTHTLLRTEKEREREQGSSPEPSGSCLDEAHLSLVPPLVAADAPPPPTHSSTFTPCEATACPLTDSLLSSSLSCKSLCHPLSSSPCCPSEPGGCWSTSPPYTNSNSENFSFLPHGRNWCQYYCVSLKVFLIQRLCYALKEKPGLGWTGTTSTFHHHLPPAYFSSCLADSC